MVIPDTYVQGRRFRESRARAKLVRMLQSMSQRFPNTYLHSTEDAFGVSSAATGYLRVAYSGSWTVDNLRDYLVLFVTLLSVDPSALVPEGETQSARSGVSSKDRAP